MDQRGAAGPELPAMCQAQVPGDPRQPVAGGPTHQRREGMDRLAAAILPDAGVGLIVQREGTLAEQLQRAEQALVAWSRQPAIEKRMADAQDRGTVHIVLGLRIGGIAHPHRAHAPIAAQRSHAGLDQFACAAQGVDRLQLAVFGIGDDVLDVQQVALHRRGRPQPVQRIDHEIGVAQPAEAVVPVAGRKWRLGYRGGQRGDDAAGIVESVQLQRDRRPDHRLLPFERQRQVAHPGMPIAGGLVEHVAGDLARAVGQRLVRPDDAGEFIVQVERAALDHLGDRRVGGQPHRIAGNGGAQVMAAEGQRRRLRTVFAARIEHDPDPRPPGQPPDDAHNAHRGKHPAELVKSRREIDQFQRTATVIGHDGAQNRCIAQVMLLNRRTAVEFDREATPAACAAQQRAKYRVAVKARYTHPDDIGLGIDQRTDAGISDHGELEVRIFFYGHGLFPTLLFSSSPQRYC